MRPGRPVGRARADHRDAGVGELLERVLAARRPRVVRRRIRDTDREHLLPVDQQDAGRPVNRDARHAVTSATSSKPRPGGLSSVRRAVARSRPHSAETDETAPAHTMPGRASAESSILGAVMFWIFIAIVWVIAMGVGLWIVFHSYPDPDRIDVKRYAYRPQGLLVIGGASVVFVLATVFFSFAQVNTGHVGVVRTFGRISGPDQPGHLADRALADATTPSTSRCRSRRSTNLTAFSAETQNVNITTTINYSVAPDGRARPDRARRHRLVRPPGAEQPQPGLQGRGGQVHGREHRAEPRADPHGRAQGAALAALAVLDPRQRPEHRQHRVLAPVRAGDRGQAGGHAGRAARQGAGAAGASSRRRASSPRPRARPTPT